MVPLPPVYCQADLTRLFWPQYALYDGTMIEAKDDWHGALGEPSTGMSVVDSTLESKTIHIKARMTGRVGVWASKLLLRHLHSSSKER